MKKSLLTISLIISATAIITLCSWDYAPLEPTSHNSTNITADDDWILIGEVTLSNYNNSSETIKANLYAREIAKNLIYRVEYQGSYYATRWHDNSQTYHITINGKTYKCDVPVMSNGSSSDNKTGLQRYVGVWKSTAKELSTGTDFGDIHISVKDNKLLVQQKTSDGLKSSHPQVYDNYIKWSADANEDYGKWFAQNTSYGEIVLGEGITWNDRAYIKRHCGRNEANREVLRYYYTAQLKDGNLEISRTYSFLYYYDRELVFSRDGDYKGYATYTQW